MISINSVTFNYRKNSKSILNNINLEIKDKEIFGILGPSGAGKTTLIKLITGQLDSQNGEILVDGCKPDVHNREFNRKFGIMMDAPQQGKRYDEYEPWKYACISVDDAYLEGVVERLTSIDFYWHTLSVKGKGLAYCGVTLVPPCSLKAFIDVIADNSELSELKKLLEKALSNNKWVIHYGL